METCAMNTWARTGSRSNNPAAALTIPFRITKGKLVAYLAWKHAGLAGQEVGKVRRRRGRATQSPATKVRGGPAQGRSGIREAGSGGMRVGANRPRGQEWRI
jgi:hypothetical protein